MAGLQGVANIAGDLIVHGQGAEEHDKNLNNALEHLSEKQLTISGVHGAFA